MDHRANWDALLAVASGESGYLPDRAPIKIFANGRLTNLEGDAARSSGPVIYAIKVMDHLTRTYPTTNHVCLPCIVKAVPATAEEIFSGLVCESPKCIWGPSKQCPCCRAALCAEHVVAGSPDKHKINSVVVQLEPRQHRDGMRISTYVSMSPRRSEFCGMCAAEDMSVVRQAVVALCQNELRLKRLEDSRWEPVSPREVPVFEVPVTLPRKARDSVRSRVDEAMRRTARQIEAEVANIPFSAAPCDRLPSSDSGWDGYRLVRNGIKV